MYNYIGICALFNAVTIGMMCTTDNENIFIFFLIYMLTMYSVLLGMYFFERSLLLVNFYLNNISQLEFIPKIPSCTACTIWNLIKISLHICLLWVYMWIQLWVYIFGMFLSLCACILGMCIIAVQSIFQIVMGFIYYPFVEYFNFFNK